MIDVPQYTESAPVIANHVYVSKSNNWDLSSSSVVTPIELSPGQDSAYAEITVSNAKDASDFSFGLESSQGSSISIKDSNNQVIASVFFNTASSQLSKSAIKELSKLAKHKSYSISGFADPRGSNAYNLKLSKARAERVAGFLTKKGFHIDKVEYYGEEQASSNPSEFKSDRRADLY